MVPNNERVRKSNNIFVRQSKDVPDSMFSDLNSVQQQVLSGQGSVSALKNSFLSVGGKRAKKVNFSKTGAAAADDPLKKHEMVTKRQVLTTTSRKNSSIQLSKQV